MMNKIFAIYASLFSKGLLGKINNRILTAALRARGYNNFQNNSESGESFFIEKILAPEKPKMCIDVGANIGNYSNELLEKTGAFVVAFEPLSTAFKEMQKNLSRHGDRVTMENMGVGDKPGMLQIHYNPDALAHASFSAEVEKVAYVSNNLREDVAVVTLDSYCLEHGIKEIDFIKIDTEGFESEVFRGAIRVFDEIKPKYIQIEFNWHQLFRNISLNYFSELLPGYDVYQLIPNGWAKRDPADPLTNIYCFSNFVFVRQQ